MAVSKKIKTIDNKMKQNKVQFYLDGQTDKIFALSSENVGKYKFLCGKDVLPGKNLLENAAVIKRFEYSPLAIELKKQTSVAEKQQQKLEKTFELNVKEEDKTKTKKIVLGQI